MGELDHRQGWVQKNWCVQIVELEKTLESSLDCKEIQPVHPKENQPWILTGRTDAEAKALMLWPPNAKSWLTRKDPDAGKDRAEGEGGDKEWDGWMASLTQRTWVWANSGRQWRTGGPGVLQAMGSQRVSHESVTEREGQVNSGNASTCQYRRLSRLVLDLWVRKVPGSRRWQPTPVFLPGKFHGQKSLAG